jgi:aspartate/glutamate racemase
LIGVGVDAVVLACTDFAPLVAGLDVPVPLYDTTALHALALAVEVCREPQITPQETERPGAGNSLITL